MKILFILIFTLPLFAQEDPTCQTPGSVHPNCANREEAESSERSSGPSSGTGTRPPGIVDCTPPPPEPDRANCSSDSTNEYIEEDIIPRCDKDPPPPPPPLPRYCRQPAWSWFPTEGTRGITCSANTSAVNGPDKEGKAGTYCVPRTGCIPNGLWLPSDIAREKSCCNIRARRTGHYCQAPIPSSSNNYDFEVTQSCTDQLADGSRRTSEDFKKSERIALAFEFLFTRTPSYDKYGFIHSIKQAASDLKNKRKQSFDEYKASLDRMTEEFISGETDVDAFGISSWKSLLEKQKIRKELYSRRAESYPGSKNLVYKSSQKIAEFNWRKKPWREKNKCGRWSIFRVLGEDHRNCSEKTWRLYSGKLQTVLIDSFLKDQSLLNNYPRQCQIDPAYPGPVPKRSPPSLVQLRTNLAKQLDSANYYHVNKEELNNTIIRSIFSYGSHSHMACNQIEASSGRQIYLRSVMLALSDTIDYYKTLATTIESGIIPCIERAIEDLERISSPSNCVGENCCENEDGCPEPESLEEPSDPSELEESPDLSELGEPPSQSRSEESSITGAIGTVPLGSISSNTGDGGYSSQKAKIHGGGTKGSIKSNDDVNGQAAFNAQKRKQKPKEKQSSLSLSNNQEKGNIKDNFRESGGSQGSRSPAGTLSGQPDFIESFGFDRKREDSTSEEENENAKQAKEREIVDPNYYTHQENDPFSSGDGADSGGDAYDKSPPERYPANSKEAEFLEEQSKSASLRNNQEDTLWQRINKFYEREAYPIMLIIEDQNSSRAKEKGDRKKKPRS